MASTYTAPPAFLTDYERLSYNREDPIRVASCADTRRAMEGSLNRLESAFARYVSPDLPSADNDEHFRSVCEAYAAEGLKKFREQAGARREEREEQHTYSVRVPNVRGTLRGCLMKRGERMDRETFQIELNVLHQIEGFAGTRHMLPFCPGDKNMHIVVAEVRQSNYTPGLTRGPIDGEVYTTNLREWLEYKTEDPHALPELPRAWQRRERLRNSIRRVGMRSRAGMAGVVEQVVEKARSAPGREWVLKDWVDFTPVIQGEPDTRVYAALSAEEAHLTEALFAVLKKKGFVYRTARYLDPKE